MRVKQLSPLQPILGFHHACLGKSKPISVADMPGVGFYPPRGPCLLHMCISRSRCTLRLPVPQCPQLCCICCQASRRRHLLRSPTMATCLPVVLTCLVFFCLKPFTQPLGFCAAKAMPFASKGSHSAVDKVAIIHDHPPKSNYPLTCRCSPGPRQLKANYTAVKAHLAHLSFPRLPRSKHPTPYGTNHTGPHQSCSHS